jgi:lipopolysaccharide/colanic/teichoic acid biosynthesis glycosyltransferase
VVTAGQEFVPMRGYQERWVYYLCKRCMDVTVSLLLLVIGFPFLLMIGLFIKLDSPGPVLFKQTRVGLRKRTVRGQTCWELGVFGMYKFRTMHTDFDDSAHREYMGGFITGDVSHGEQGKVHKPVETSELTRLGPFLRRSSLDELPQILNVLRGEMSLVGPRPNVPWEVEKYLPWHYKRLEVLPGMTGLAQVRGRSSISFAQMVGHDIEYIEKQSLILDAKILWWTLLFVISGQGAY